MGLLGLLCRISCLNNHIGDDAVKEDAVVETSLDITDEIVAMEGRVVIEADDDVALGGLDEDFSPSDGVALGVAATDEHEHKLSDERKKGKKGLRCSFHRGKFV